MKELRQLHLYLGTLCAPLILYFCLSGAWQVFGFHDIPKGEPGTVSQRALHAMSLPHTHSTPPGGDPRLKHSRFFDFAASLAAVVMILSAVLGLVLAWSFARRRTWVMACFAAGLFLPWIFLFV